MDLMYKVLNERLQVSSYFTEALSIAENEQETKNCLKQFAKEKIIAKMFSESENFIGQMISIIFPKTERLILFLYRVLKYIEQDSIEIKNEQYKEFLISKIENFDLLGIQNIGHAFIKWDKNKLISLAESLTENECKIILDDIAKSIDILKSNLDFLNKITY